MPARPTRPSPTTAQPGIASIASRRVDGGAQRAGEQRLAVHGHLAAGGVQRAHQQRGLRGRADEPDDAADRVDVDAAGRADVQHRRLGERADDLVGRGQHGVGAEAQRALGHLGVEAEVRPPGLIDDQRDVAGVRDLGERRDVRGQAVVGRGDDEGRARARRRRQGRVERVRRDAVRHAQLVVVRRRDEARAAAAEHQAVDHRRVRVALHDDRRVRRRPARGTARGCPATRRWSETRSARRRAPRRRAARRAGRASATGRGRCPRCPAGRRAAAPSARSRSSARGRRRGRPCGRGRGSASSPRKP